MSNKEQERVSFEELHSLLQTDVYYGFQFPYVKIPVTSDEKPFESVEDPPSCDKTDSIISSIYKEHSSNSIFTRFRTDFGWLPCSGDSHRHLIFIWCGLLGLKYQRNSCTPNQPRSDLLNNWMRDFDIGKQDLKLFLRKNSWPLPVTYFFSEPDNTANKSKKSPKEYLRFCELQLEELPRVQDDLRDLSKAKSETVTEHKAKQQEQSEKEKRIQMIKEGRDPDKKPARKETRNQRMLAAALEYRKGPKKKSWHWISRTLEKMDIAEGLKKGSIREILRDTLKTKKMEGK